MYDKLKIWLPRTTAHPDIANYLDSAKEQVDHNTGEVKVFGSLNGLKVNIYTGGFSIIGSLAKFYYPNNIYTLDRHSTKEAIEKLSDSLHIDVKDGKITGIEFGTNYQMSQKVEQYLSKLGEKPKAYRSQIIEKTLYYQPKGRKQPKVLCFYDKQADAATKGLILPDGLKASNMLRYELRLNGRLSQQIGVPEVTASTLSNKDFYRILLKRYQSEYFTISKRNQLKTDVMTEIRTVTDAYDVFVARLLAQSSQSQVTEFINELKASGALKDSQSIWRLKKKITEVASKANITETDELIKELDNEIKNVGAYF